MVQIRPQTLCQKGSCHVGPGDDRIRVSGAQIFGGQVDAVGIKRPSISLVALVSVMAEFL